MENEIVWLGTTEHLPGFSPGEDVNIIATDSRGIGRERSGTLLGTSSAGVTISEAGPAFYPWSAVLRVGKQS